MFVDFRSGDAESDIHCDICIVGAGPAGITLARDLIGSNIEVCVLESGGFEFSEPVQSLYEGEEVGLQNASPAHCRLRYFGGTCNHWAGWCAPLQDIDFETRAWVSESGWPFSRVELLPWYEKAREVCQVEPPGMQADEFYNTRHDLPEFRPDKAGIDYFRYSPPTRFGQVYRQELDAADNVRVFLNANVLRLETSASGSEVREVHIRTLGGKNGSVRAGIVVLACGGMENARLLLLSNEVESGGLGNASGRLGRYFMQHIEGVVARILTPDPQSLARNFNLSTVEGHRAPRAEISVSPQAQQKSGTLNSGFTIDAYPDHGPGYLALRKLWGQLRRGVWPDDFSKRLETVMNDLGSLGEVLHEPEQYLVSLYARAETAPNPESRISLSDSRDAFGLPRIKVNWQLTPFDKYSLSESVRTVAGELGRLDLGRLELADWVMPGNKSWPQPLWGGCHHMGSTRMSEDAGLGVVDRNCRVHSVGNLYIAGSSVFPTSGYVQPTLTIVALALRLGAHLRQQFKMS